MSSLALTAASGARGAASDTAQWPDTRQAAHQAPAARCAWAWSPPGAARPAQPARAGGAQDLPRTFPGNAWVAASAGQGALRRVLLAFSAHAPAVGYCQGMNYLGALALLALGRAEEPAFWLLAAMIDDGGARRPRQAAAARSRRAPRRAALAPTCGAVHDARRAGARAQASCTATRTRTTWWARTWRCARWRCGGRPGTFVGLAARFPLAAHDLAGRQACGVEGAGTGVASGQCAAHAGSSIQWTARQGVAPRPSPCTICKTWPGGGPNARRGRGAGAGGGQAAAAAPAPGRAGLRHDHPGD